MKKLNKPKCIKFEHHSLPLFTYLGVSGDIFAPIRTSILRAHSTLLGMPRIQEVLKEEIIEKFGKG